MEEVSRKVFQVVEGVFLVQDAELGPGGGGTSLHQILTPVPSCLTWSILLVHIQVASDEWLGLDMVVRIWLGG